MKLLTTTVFLIFTAFLSVDAAAYPRLFGKGEVTNSDIDEFPKWIEAIEKKEDEYSSYQKKCEAGSKVFFCNIKDWRNFLSTLKGKPAMDQVRAVNKFANSRKYILDIDNWGKTDYWESPGEFLFKNGDCEDYAIIKYFSLKELGFDVSNLRIVVLMDNNLGIYHSVLATYLGDEIYILDNQIKNTTNSKNIYHYAPVYSINENNWWRHM